MVIDPADFQALLDAALAVNDALRINVDHVVYEGSMNAAEDLREITNHLDWKYYPIEVREQGNVVYLVPPSPEKA